SIDTTPGKTPEETIDRAARIRAAALAPAQPSGQDLAVAAQADQMAREARAELEHERAEETAKRAEEPRATRVDGAAARAYGADVPAPRTVSRYL
ncbi:hypothetical protein L6R52_21050, partial [Myxococcota bacterium]|nr:hypothetical protein [Myxococcota bacterium]